MPLERRARRLQAIAVSLVLAAIVVAFNLTPGSLPFVGKILRYLLFLPIVMAALWFGWRGSLVTALAATVFYLPADHSEDAMVEAVDLFLIGCIMGILADRERRKRILLQQTTRELSLAYQQLQDSMESLRRAARLSATGQLAAGLAHEIRTPLASIEGAAEMLDDDLKPELRSEMTGILRRESRRLSRLLAGLLNYAKPQPPEFRHSDVRELLSSMIALATPSARQSNVLLRFDPPASPVALFCDGEQLTQVFLNLTMNAIQAMPSGGAVDFSIESTPTALRIRVADTGPGIPADKRDRIFDPFVTTKPDGTGLGLAVSAQIVAAHLGRITVERRTPHGSEFIVELPIQQENQ